MGGQPRGPPDEAQCLCTSAHKLTTGQGTSSIPSGLELLHTSSEEVGWSRVLPVARPTSK